MSPKDEDLNPFTLKTVHDPYENLTATDVREALATERAAEAVPNRAREIIEEEALADLGTILKYTDVLECDSIVFPPKYARWGKTTINVREHIGREDTEKVRAVLIRAAGRGTRGFTGTVRGIRVDTDDLVQAGIMPEEAIAKAHPNQEAAMGEMPTQSHQVLRDFARCYLYPFACSYEGDGVPAWSQNAYAARNEEGVVLYNTTAGLNITAEALEERLRIQLGVRTGPLSTATVLHEPDGKSYEGIQFTPRQAQQIVDLMEAEYYQGKTQGRGIT